MREPRNRAVLVDLEETIVDFYAALTIAVNHARATAGLHAMIRS